MRKSEKWQLAAAVLMAAAWPVVNSIDGGLVDGLFWNVLMFALAFAALGCALRGSRLEENERRRFGRRMRHGNN